MIKRYPFEHLGKADHGWLKANHHFSFAHYYRPDRMAFGKVRVINDDWIAPGAGFPPHPHNNMEIITFVRSGAVTHEDNAGNKGTTKHGEVQVMSAGSGIVHSEYNLSKDPLTLYQIWIDTNVQNVTPRWDSRQFPAEFSSTLPLLVSGYQEDSDDALFIHQHARIYGGKVAKGNLIEHPIHHQAYVLASNGSFELIKDDESVILKKGDGAEITETNDLQIKALENSEIVIIDAPNH
jgi:redox-sensitive bicupin YhaK (pirin superfamily)